MMSSERIDGDLSEETWRGSAVHFFKKSSPMV